MTKNNLIKEKEAGKLKTVIGTGRTLQKKIRNTNATVYKKKEIQMHLSVWL